MGGGAILDGVVIRSARWRVAARRCANGTIAIAVGEVARAKLHEVPFVRSFLTWFVDAPSELQWSTAKLEAEREGRDSNVKPPPREYHDYRGATPVCARDSLPPVGTRSPSRVVLVIVALCALFQIGTHLLLRIFGVGAAPSTVLFGIAMVALLVAIEVIYLILIPRVFTDFRKLFQYNAAFKMACWSAGDDAEPTVGTIRRHPSWHYKSGLIALTLDGAALALLPALTLAWVPPMQGNWGVQHGVVLAIRLLLVPIIVTTVEEGLSALNRSARGRVTQLLFAPFALLDGLVARVPTDAELAVAVTALRELRRIHDEHSP